MGAITGHLPGVKGFKPSHVLYDDGRHTGVDGPLLPERQLLGWARAVEHERVWAAPATARQGRNATARNQVPSFLVARGASLSGLCFCADR
jgi:hypothetical protein